MEDLRTADNDHLPRVHTLRDGPECPCGQLHTGQQHLFDPAPYDRDHDAPYAGAARTPDPDDTAPFDSAALNDLLNRTAPAPDDFVFGTSKHHDIKFPTPDESSDDWSAYHDDLSDD